MIRDARPEDARAVEQVRVAGWRAAYRGLVADDLLDALEVTGQRVADLTRAITEPGPYDVALVAEQAGAVVAMARLSPCGDDDLDPATTAELRALYVDPGSWATGLGGRLLDEGFGRLPHPLQVLWTLEGNARARAFYERRGFVRDGAGKVRDLGGPAREVRYRRPRP
ncbi:MAG TPA: GNAT family N-acetyltransferase [Mycobacteriales bacterium]|jgi:GNAT superfamily N-acetyltransferase|nr:GNAT family N-acetyltransferase [Mycobacteriales bacterium]